MRLSKAIEQAYRAVAAEYATATGQTELCASEVVTWAEKSGLDLPPLALADVHATRLSEALRRHTMRDSQGRNVRLYHCVERRVLTPEGRLEQRHLWAHIDQADDEFLIQSLNQRRAAIKCDVEKLRADLDFINARRALRQRPLIQLSFNFEDA